MSSPRVPFPCALSVRSAVLAILAAWTSSARADDPALALGDPIRVEAIDCAPGTMEPDRCAAFNEPAGDGPRHARSLAQLASDTSHPDWTIRWHAVNALGTRRDPTAIPVLVRVVLHDDNHHPRWRALWAIKAIEASGSSAVSAFRRASDDPEPAVALNAAVALAYFGRAEARSALVQALHDADPFRRWEAAFSLRKIGDRSLAGDLERALAQEPDYRVSNELRRVLRLVAKPSSPEQPQRLHCSSSVARSTKEVTQIR